MKKAKSVLLLLLCAVLLVGASVAGTMAYLTDTKTVTNTFTVGKVGITLDEAKVNEYGERLNNQNGIYNESNGDTLENRVTTNTYKLIPGRTYTKDPILHIEKGSEPCYVYIKIENGILHALSKEESTTLGAQMEENGWEQMDGDLWFKLDPVDAREAQQDLDTFTAFTLADQANVSSFIDADGKVTATITVQAYAVQADGFNAGVVGGKDVPAAIIAWFSTFGESADGN